MQCQQCQHPLAALRQEIARLEGVAQRDERPVVSSGVAALDRLLPEGGVRRGALVEWLAADEALGATTLALRVAREACRDGGTLVVLDRQGEFYPPAAARLGIDLARLLLLHPGTRADHDWALDQALRCGAVSAVLAWPDTPHGTLDSHTFRRWQLAAEAGGVLGLLLRPATVRGEPSWADVRLLVEARDPPLPLQERAAHSPPLPLRERVGVRGKDDCRPLQIILLRCRGGSDGRSLELELDDESHPVPMAARLAPAMAPRRRRAAGA